MREFQLKIMLFSRLKFSLFFAMLFSTKIAYAQNEPVPDNQHTAGVFVTKTHPENRDGKRFPFWFEVFYPSKTPIGLLIVQHGLREHIKLRPELVTMYTTAGWAVAGMDLPGHGGSPNLDSYSNIDFDSPKDRALYDIPSLGTALLEFTALIQNAVSERYSLQHSIPTVEYAHSVGGAILQDALLANAQRGRISVRGDSTLGRVVELAGAILSSPATDIFFTQKPLAPFLSVVGRHLPSAPIFPLPDFLFWPEGNPSRQEFDYYDEFVQSVYDVQERDSEPFLVEKEWSWIKQYGTKTRRSGNAGAWHPAVTAKSIIEAAGKRWSKLRTETYPPLEIKFPIALMHSPGDAVTNPVASARSLQEFPLGGERLLVPGALPHGEVEDATYLVNLLDITSSMRTGKSLGTINHENLIYSPRLTDSALNCLGKLRAKVFRTPAFGLVK